MAIKTVGTQAFLASSKNKVSINLAHIIKVYETEYDYYEGTAEQIEEGEGTKVVGTCLAIRDIDNSMTYFGHHDGYTSRDSGYYYKVYDDSSLMRELYELFF